MMKLRGHKRCSRCPVQDKTGIRLQERGNSVSRPRFETGTSGTQKHFRLIQPAQFSYQQIIILLVWNLVLSHEERTQTESIWEQRSFEHIQAQEREINKKEENHVMSFTVLLFAKCDCGYQSREAEMCLVTCITALVSIWLLHLKD